MRLLLRFPLISPTGTSAQSNCRTQPLTSRGRGDGFTASRSGRRRVIVRIFYDDLVPELVAIFRERQPFDHVLAGTLSASRREGDRVDYQRLSFPLTDGMTELRRRDVYRMRGRREMNLASEDEAISVDAHDRVLVADFAAARNRRLSHECPGPAFHATGQRRAPWRGRRPQSGRVQCAHV